MADEVPCARHDTPTRLTCAECGTPICPECLVKTSVGLKCPDHAEVIVPRMKRRSTGLVLTGVGLLALIGVVALVISSGGGVDAPERGEPGGVASPSPDKIQTPQVWTMAADGSGKRTLTNRPLAFDAAPAWAPDGSQVAFESLSDGKRSIWVVQADGERIRRLSDGAGMDSSPAWSPDGSRIAFMSDRDTDWEIYLMNADGTGERRLTTQAGTDGYPAWAPDGSRIAFVSDRDGGPKVWTMSEDGSDPTRFLDLPALGERPSFSPDGRRLAFTSNRDGNPEIYIVSVDGSGLSRLTDNPGNDGEPALSPDGTRMAFASDRDGVPAVYVMAVDGSGVRKLTSGPRGYMPGWSPDGRNLVYISDPGPLGGN